MYLRYAACGDPRSAGVSAVNLQPGAGGVHPAAQLADVPLPGSLQLTEELGHRLINMQLAETSEIFFSKTSTKTQLGTLTLFYRRGR